MLSLPSLLVACKYSDLARWYILRLTCAVSVSSRCRPIFDLTAQFMRLRAAVVVDHVHSFAKGGRRIADRDQIRCRIKSASHVTAPVT